MPGPSLSATYLGIDVGGTATRWVVIDNTGGIVERGDAPGATGHVFNPHERERLSASLFQIANKVRGHGPQAAYLGITGLGGAAHMDVRRMVSAHLAIEPHSIRLGNDMELAFRAVYAPGEGHLVSAGTGSIGVHLTATGEMIRVGGRGLLIDDAGSGTWIALTALNELYRRIDETGGPAEAAILAQELYADMGGEGWEQTRSFVYGSDRGRIGALALAVSRAATRGDALATNILNKAAFELARLARALIARAGALPISFVGGVIALHPDMRPMLQTALPEAPVSFPQIDAATQAARWARQIRHQSETNS